MSKARLLTFWGMKRRKNYHEKKNIFRPRGDNLS